MISKRQFFWMVIAAGLGLHASVAATAQSYPQRPIRIVVDRPAGSPHDLVTRALADRLSQSLKQTILVENRPGAGGNLAAEFVVRSAPDGHTLLVALDTTITVNPQLYKNLSFDPQRDLRPISILAMSSTMLVVHPSIPVNSVAEFVAYAKKNPVTYAHGGNGSPGHLSMEYFRMLAGFQSNPVPYRGNPQLVSDLVAGQIKFGFVGTGGVLEHVLAGRLRGLAISASRRAVLAPDVPTIAEAGYPDFKSEVYYVMLAPAGTPEPILAGLEREVTRALKSPGFQEKLRFRDSEVAATTGAEARARMEADAKMWAKVIAATNMRVD
jgi:tripartite-type tricarboxylate transporter receptor subunit TctC